LKLLIADDSLTQRVMLQAIVGKWGFTPVMAENGQQALDVLSSDDCPQLLLLDWEMPGVDGLQVCESVREREDGDQFYILLLTGRTETGDIIKGLEAGANDYVAKPFENAELKARLDNGHKLIGLQNQLQRANQLLDKYRDRAAGS
jgi:DNA-binding response OmpR family regulator